MEVEAAKLIGAGLAVVGVIGSGIGIGSIFISITFFDINLSCLLLLNETSISSIRILIK